MRIFIFLHGADKQVFLKLKPKIEEPIICADSGIKLVLDLPYKPKNLLLIGDLDSVSKKEKMWCEENNYSIKKYPENKDCTDGELAFSYACKKYPKASKIIIGGISSLLDHTLGNIFSLVTLVENGQRASVYTTNQIIYVTKNTQKIKNCKGHTISIIPLKKTKVLKTKGLEWPLEKETIIPYKSRTLRNKAIEKNIEIQLKEGLVIIVQSWEQ
ncbi:MAG: thiamine diphosphokinase [bacterium]|nr:thiamine diphosphokinase [bacterium]